MWLNLSYNKDVVKPHVKELLIMNEILTTLFLSNPYLPGQVCDFCNQLPEFRKAEQDYNAAAAKLRARLGYAEFEAFEETLNWHIARYAHAYYLFGLSLRQEILSALAS